MPKTIKHSSEKLRNKTYKRSFRGGDIETGTESKSTGGLVVPTQGMPAFDTPNEIEEWFRPKDKTGTPTKDTRNLYRFVYGLGNFLKFKEESVNARLSNINGELQKLNEDFQLSIDNYLGILGERSEDDKDMRAELQAKLEEQLAQGYESKYLELIQKKQSYQMIIRFIQNRRAYIVYQLQNDGGYKLIDNIVEKAKTIYNLYRGEKYKAIRRDKIYNIIGVIAYTPSALKNSFQLNCVITGPAGSGKTTMARVLAKWYSAIGLLTFDSFNENDEIAFAETGRSNFIAEYQGQTAPKTIGTLYQSLEKTLFMDEAYSIAGCNFDRDTGKLDPDAYGEEFLAELLRFMNDHKGMNAIIIAGYKNLMQKCFLERNEGLPRRFPKYIDLPLASTDELFNIFLNIVVDKGIDDIDSAVKQLSTEIRKEEKAQETSEDPTKFNDSIRSLKEAKAAKEKVKAEMKKDKVKFYTVMKPSFMMLHYDTTYHAIEQLRKYLISMAFRLAITKEKDIDLDKIFSYTIMNHVLINLFNSDLRRNLMRRHFYGEVFQNSDVNLSFFKAQAGEMGLIADLCTQMIEANVTEDDVAVSKVKEENLLNTYFMAKNVKITLYKKGDTIVEAEEFVPNTPTTPPLHVSASPGPESMPASPALASSGAESMPASPALASSGAESRRSADASTPPKSAPPSTVDPSSITSEPVVNPPTNYYLEVHKADTNYITFQGYINSFLGLETIFEAYNEEPNATKEKSIEKDLQDAQLKAEIAEDLQSALVKDIAKDSLTKGGLTIEQRLKRAVGLTKKLQELSKLPESTSSNSTVQRNPRRLTSLLTLYTRLFNREEVENICKKLVDKYLEKTTIEYVNSLLARIETDFPIHLQRAELEGELAILASTTNNPRDTILNDMMNQYDEVVAKYTEGPTSLKNIKQIAYEKSRAEKSGKDTLIESTLKSDALWEDFGFY